MSKKIRVGLLFGGKSTEHEISLLSAKNILKAIDKDKYEVVLIGIDKKGRWQLREETELLSYIDNPHLIYLSEASHSITLVPKEEKEGKLVSLSTRQHIESLDVIFPILHGTNGEDGTIQGLLQLAHIPFVGAGVLGSAIGMDKEVMKRLLKEAGIPIPKFLTLDSFSVSKYPFSAIEKQLGLPCFVKPVNLGSSVGVSKVKKEEDWHKAVDLAFMYGKKILVEQAIVGREIECSVVGNEEPMVSIPGEVILQEEFYSYDAKYLAASGTAFKIPPDLEEHIIKKVQLLAAQTYKTLYCEGMARVDFFVTEKGDIFVNEINTIPGFTSTSIYPKLWEASGVPCSSLIDWLIDLAIKRFEREKKFVLGAVADNPT